MDTKLLDKFDKAIDTKGLAEDAKKIKEEGGKGEYKDVPTGEYIVEINKLELVTSKSGKPMVSCWMKILEGEYKNSILFFNQVIDQSFGVHKANEFLESLESEMVVEFITFKQYNELVMDIYETISNKLEYRVNFSKDKKDFSVYTVTEVFEKA